MQSQYAFFVYLFANLRIHHKPQSVYPVIEIDWLFKWKEIIFQLLFGT